MSGLPIDRRFAAARRDRSLAVLEGFHAVKHALRFAAEVIEAVATDVGLLERLAGELAPDLAGWFAANATPVERLPDGPGTSPTGLNAIARRPAFDRVGALADPRAAPVVLLEAPRHLGNLGACVRVAAAADAAAVLTTGDADPWHPDALRGAAGLHFALPVGRVRRLPPSERPLVAVDPDGDPAAPVPPRAILAFGTERHGLSPELKAAAAATIAIPMRPGVSSLNLATSVAAVLFGARMGGEGLEPPAPCV